MHFKFYMLEIKNILISKEKMSAHLNDITVTIIQGPGNDVSQAKKGCCSWAEHPQYPQLPGPAKIIIYWAVIGARLSGCALYVNLLYYELVCNAICNSFTNFRRVHFPQFQK